MGNLRVLRGFRTLSPDALSLVRSLSRNSDIRVALWAFAALARTADWNDLSNLCRTAQAGSPPGVGYNFAPIGYIATPYLLRPLECLARTPASSEVNVPAMRAIVGIGSAQSVPEIIKHLEDNNSRGMQDLALAGLRKIVRPSPETDPSRAIQSWRDWWEQTGNRLYPVQPGQ
jgi:hypothetical protein